jgi:hypothetical protein
VDAIELKQNRPVTLNGWQHAAIFLFACAVLVTRRPDAILDPQFWAEDGTIFFSQAYNLGWFHALFHAYAGYFHAIPRLAASLALLAPLSIAPLVTNLIAIGLWALPVNLLLSARSAAWGSLQYRGLLACSYLALPNCAEVGYGVTNSQWLVALSAFLLLVAAPAKTRGIRIAELFFLALAGLTGPFSLFLLPIAIFLAWKRRGPWNWGSAGVLATCSILQVCGLLVVDPTRWTHHPLGANAGLFMRILGGQIYFGALLGGNSLANSTSPLGYVLLMIASIAGTALLAYCFLRSGLEMKLLLVLAAMVLAGSLVSSTMNYASGQPVWEMLAESGGLRYWFFPTLACVWTILWTARSQVKGLQAASVVFLCVLCFGVVRSWKIRTLPDLHYTDYAKSFGAAPNGTVAVIPENPQGWNIRLVKHQQF